jgi:hypothetical protein
VTLTKSHTSIKLSGLAIKFGVVIFSGFGCEMGCFELCIHMKGLILAQNERWRRGLGMQVERESVN